MKTEYLFIGGCPRSGTSLLSALIGNLTGVAVVQDFCLLFYLKLAAMRVMLKTQNVELDSNQIDILSVRLVATIDTRETEFFREFLASSLEEVLNQFGKVNGMVLRDFVWLIDRFLFEKLNESDPRKDRGQGTSYLRNFDFSDLLDQESMDRVLQALLKSSAVSLSAIGTNGPKVVCDKTPENLICLDVIDQVMGEDGYNFLHLVRDPVAVFGARRQRLDLGVGKFIEFFKMYSEPSLSPVNCISFATVRYEDIVENPSSVLTRIMHDLDFSCLVDVGSIDELSDSINPGKYINYVGQKVDPKRNLDNINNVSSEEQAEIYNQLGSYCEKYFYGPYRVKS